MTDLPAQVGYGRVTYTRFAAAPDSADALTRPDSVTQNGTVLFTPSVSSVIRYTTGAPPFSLDVPQVVCNLVAGQLVSPMGEAWVDLVAASPVATPPDLMWTALIVAGGKVDTIPFALASGAAIDLTNYASGSPAPASPATIIGPKGDKGDQGIPGLGAVGGIYSLTDYGVVDTTGVASSAPAWNACLAAIYAGGGGVMQLPAGKILVPTQTVLASANPSSSGATNQPPLTIRGVGGHFHGQNALGTGGTRLLLTYQGAATPADSKDAKIVTYGMGVLTFEHIVLQDTTANSSTPFVYTTATTLKVEHDVAVLGATAGVTCAQDAFILGGTTVALATGYGLPDAPFQGYGTKISSAYFNRIRRAVYGRTYCNQVVVSDNFFDKGCGSNLPSGACIEFDGGLGGGNAQCAVNVVTGNYFENTGYVYGVLLRAGQWSYIAGNGFEDTGVNFIAGVRMEISGTQSSVFNTIVGNYHTVGDLISEDATSAGKNLILSPGGSANDFSVVPGNLKLLGNLPIEIGNATLKGNYTSTQPWLHTIPAPTAVTQYTVKDATKTWLALGSGAGGTWLLHAPTVVDATMTIGDRASGAATLNLDSTTGAATQIQYKRNGVNSWLMYDGISTSLFLRDSVNAKMHVTYAPGATAAAALTTFDSSVRVNGNVGFYNTAPIAKQTVVAAATDPATTQALVNDLRAKLIALGLIA